MAKSDETPEGSKSKGFAGLGKMVSDVDATIADAGKPTPTRDRQPAPNARDTTPNEVPKSSRQPPVYSPPPTADASTGKKWLIGIAAVVALILFIGYLADGSSKSTAPTQASSADYSRPSEPASSPAPTRPTEARPAVGQNNVLAGAQLRYCVAEKIRLDAAETAVNSYDEVSVERFNSYVGDYNARCGEFRYRQGSLQSAERAMEPYRRQLEAEGRGRVMGSAPVGATRPNGGEVSGAQITPPQPTPDETVLAIQQLLNVLGYDAGIADGFAGQKTVAAIRSFQRDRGLTPDGRATDGLVQLMKSAASDASGPSVATDRSLSTDSSKRSARQSGNPENFNTCISGEWPNLCKHSLLSQEEAEQVAAAERRANFKTCIAGEWPNLCKHKLLTADEAQRVAAAEHLANYKTCISGEYPNLCKHGLLAEDEARNVAAAERAANLRTCMSGDYPALCKHSLLSVEEAARVASAERAANLKICLDGLYANLCKHSLLSEAEARAVAAAERLAASR